MKRVLLVLVIVTAAAAASFAKEMPAIGIYGDFLGNSTGGGSGGLGLTLQFGHFPVLGIEYMIDPRVVSLGVSCDYWVLNDHLVGALNYYLGLGAYAGFTVGGQSSFNIGGRVPIGLQIYPIKKFEVFLEAAPMVLFLPSISLGYSARLGFRVHF